MISRSLSAAPVLAARSLVAYVLPGIGGGFVPEVAQDSSPPLAGRRPVLLAEVGLSDRGQPTFAVASRRREWRCQCVPAFPGLPLGSG